jgi:hypothetical protein
MHFIVQYLKESGYNSSEGHNANHVGRGGGIIVSVIVIIHVRNNIFFVADDETSSSCVLSLVGNDLVLHSSREKIESLGQVVYNVVESNRGVHAGRSKDNSDSHDFSRVIVIERKIGEHVSSAVNELNQRSFHGINSFSNLTSGLVSVSIVRHRTSTSIAMSKNSSRSQVADFRKRGSKTRRTV